MGIFSALKGMFAEPPPGPAYNVGDLEFHLEEYSKHVIGAHDILMKHLPKDAAYNHVVVNKGSNDDPITRLGKTRWRSLRNVEERVGAFVRDVETYTDGRLPPQSTAGCHRPNVVFGNNLNAALRHIEYLRPHEDAILAAMRFFLCDRRSNFDSEAADMARFGESGSLERASWHYRGTSSLKASFDTIRDNLTKVAEYERNAR